MHPLALRAAAHAGQQLVNGGHLFKDSRYPENVQPRSSTVGATITAENLTRTFGVPLTVAAGGGRAGGGR